ncbi:unnamed protein product [Pichia kudriavzevii]
MTIDQKVYSTPYRKDCLQRERPSARRFTRNIIQGHPRYANWAVSAPHWQLKDMMAVSQRSGGTEFQLPYENKVFNFSMDQLQFHVNTKHVKYSSYTFTTNARCIKHLEGITVLGGIHTSSDSISMSKGSFSYYNDQTNITENIQVGEFINNSVSINGLSRSHYLSYLCNNDKNLYRYDITPSRIVQSSNPTYLHFALNHSILSSDNKTLITVGDSSRILISHPQENNPKSLSFKDFDIIETFGDCGFSTSFLSNGNQFVTCFQDGLALLYDLRNLSNPIHSIHSTRPKSQPGAFRVVKTSASNDLIAISEHQGRIHLLDSRNLNNHSVVLLPKYLYNVPPTIKLDDDGNNEDSQIFGRYPIATSADPSKDISNQWFYEPIVKDIDDLKEMRQFGGELNMGYLESYRYLDPRFGSTFGTTRSMLHDQYRILLQGSFDREDTLRRRGNMEYDPQASCLLNHDPPAYKIKRSNIRKIQNWWLKANNDNNSNYENSSPYGTDTINYKEQWPWGKEIPREQEDSMGTQEVNILEVPERDPFFYVDSDIEINGLEFMDNGSGNASLCIGTREGIVLWDINERERNTNATYEYM